jgi:hypothetical protein
MALTDVPAELRRLLEALREAPWLPGTLADLAAHGQGLAALLERALEANAEALPAATALLDALWARAETEVGWSEPVWREAFVVASVCASVNLCPAASKLALRRLDEAFIMGGPAEILEPFIQLVEPLVVLDSGEQAAMPEASATPLQGAPPFSHAVPRLHNPTSAQFLEYFRADRPVIVDGCAEDWPARRLWADWDWWRQQYGHRHVPLEVGAFNDPGWHEEVSLVRGFVDRLAGGGEIMYLAQHTLFDQLPGLRQHFSEPGIVRGRVTRTNAWIGSANTVTPCHYDSYDGLLVQVVGVKHVRLYAPSDTPFLYPTSTPWTAQRRWPTDSAASPAAPGTVGRGTISLVDVAAPDAARFPLFEKATCVEAWLQPGDALFIPAGWWHWVHAVSRSISISFVL